MSNARRIGLFQATMLVAGNMVGAGIFMMPAIMASIGTSSTLGWLVTVPGAFLIAALFGGLGRGDPSAGGPYAYARRSLGDFAGFQCTLLYWLSNVIANIAIATSITGYTSIFLPGLREPLVAAAFTIGVIWVSALVNLVGPRLVTRIEAVTTILGIGPIALAGIAGWFFFDPQVFQAGWTPEGGSLFGATMASVSIMFWAFMGIESASVVAAVVENPEKNVPRATYFGVAIAAVIYVLGTTAIMGILPNAELRISSAPFADAAAVAIGSVGLTVIGVCAIVKGFGCLLGWTLVNAETALATARDGLFPSVFAVTDRRGVPARGLIVVAAIMSAIVLATISPTAADGFKLLADMSVLLVLTPYIFAAAAVAHYIAIGVLTRIYAWIGLAVVAYCLTVIVASAGSAVAISMAFGLAAAPLFRAFLAFTGSGKASTAIDTSNAG